MLFLSEYISCVYLSIFMLNTPSFPLSSFNSNPAFKIHELPEARHNFLRRKEFLHESWIFHRLLILLFVLKLIPFYNSEHYQFFFLNKEDPGATSTNAVF